MIETNVRNVICGGTIGITVSPDLLATLSGAMYHPKEFPGVRFRLNDCTVMIFGTGSVVVVGATTQQKAFTAMDMLITKLKAAGIRTGVVSRKVHNVVATAYLGDKLDLGAACKVLPRSMYEPEHFSGIITRRSYPRCTMLLFASGNLVCVGADSVQGASDAVNQLYDELSRGNIL